MTFVRQRLSTCALTFSWTRRGRASLGGAEEICRLAARVVRGASQRFKGASAGSTGMVTGISPGTKDAHAPKEAAAAPHSVCPHTTTTREDGWDVVQLKVKERKHRVLRQDARLHKLTLQAYCHLPG